MSSKENKQVALQLVASVVVAGIIVIGISALAGYLPVPGQAQNQTTSSQPSTYYYVTTTCDVNGCSNVVETGTVGGSGSSTTGTATGTTTSTTTTATSTGSAAISNFQISGTPSASFSDTLMKNAPAILIVAALAGLVGIIVREARKKKP